MAGMEPFGPQASLSPGSKRITEASLIKIECINIDTVA